MLSSSQRADANSGLLNGLVEEMSAWTTATLCARRCGKPCMARPASFALRRDVKLSRERSPSHRLMVEKIHEKKKQAGLNIGQANTFNFADGLSVVALVGDRLPEFSARYRSRPIN